MALANLQLPDSYARIGYWTQAGTGAGFILPDGNVWA